jgi:valyl-tRNA synthetase
MSAAFTSYRFNDAGIAAYEFFWNDFCDWYVEATKLSIKGDVSDEEKDRATTILLDVLCQSLKLLHPLIPFVTEEIYSKFPSESKPEGLLINAKYPEYDEGKSDPEGEKRFAFLQDLVRQIRTCRSECTVAPGVKLNASVKTNAALSGFLKENAELVKLLASLEELQIMDDNEKPAHGETTAEDEARQGLNKNSINFAGTDWEATLFLGGAVDLKDLKAKFEKNLLKDKKYIASLEAKIANPDFIKNAPPELVEEEKQKCAEAKERTGKIEAYLSNLE